MNQSAENTPFTILRSLRSCKDCFLSMTAALLSDEDLWKIARADYGMGAEACFEQLVQIRQTKQLPETFSFSLQEVIELTRWIEPENQQEHVIRAFCCSCLLMAVPSLHLIDETATLACLIESTIPLDEAIHQAAFQFINWRILQDFQEELSCMDEGEGEDDVYIDPFFIYAWLLLMILNHTSEAGITTALNWLLKETGGNYDAYMNEQTQDETFLLGSTHFNQRHSSWKAVTQQILAETDFIHDEKIKTILAKISEAIVNGKKLDPGAQL